MISCKIQLVWLLRCIVKFRLYSLLFLLITLSLDLIWDYYKIILNFVYYENKLIRIY